MLVRLDFDFYASLDYVSEPDEAEIVASTKVESTTEAKLKSVGALVTSIASTRVAEAHCVRTRQRAEWEVWCQVEAQQAGE